MNNDPSQEKTRLDELLKNKKILYQTSAIFPFHLSPDQIVIDTQKVTIFYNQFLGPTSAETVLIDNIGDVDIDVSFVFGALKILSSSHQNQWLEITHLPKSEAIKARRIIEGLLIARKEGIDLSEVEDQELVDKLESLGSSR